MFPNIVHENKIQKLRPQKIQHLFNNNIRKNQKKKISKT